MVRLFTCSLLAALAVVSMTLLLPMSVANADMIPSTPASAPAPSDASPKAVVAGQLALQGLDPDEVAARLAQLTPNDMQTLADNPNQVSVAGAAGVGAGVIVAIILGLVLIAVLVLDSMRAKEHEQYRSY